MFDIVQVNTDVLDFLEKERQSNPKLTFALRKSNYSDRLTEGFWFYGNEDYLSLSFWSGMDWKNRTPNISFVITKEGQTLLDINVSDSDYKRDFVKSFLVEPLGLSREGRRFIKWYSKHPEDIFSSLHAFLHSNGRGLSDKEKIDEIIFQNPRLQSSAQGYEDIGLINVSEFKRRLEKIRKYRELKDQNNTDFDAVVPSTGGKPFKLAGLAIKHYGIIDSIGLDDIPRGNKWIFITGENGSGKTNLLRAISTVLGARVLNKKEMGEKVFLADVDCYGLDGVVKFKRKANKEATSLRRPIVSGLAMYGPYRLDVVGERISPSKFKKELGKNESFRSLFESGVELLNIDKQFEIWHREKNEIFEKRKEYITNVFADIVPTLYNIIYEAVDGNSRVTKYLIKNSDNDEGRELRWSDLSSGTKSVIAMVGDIMIRLFDQQRNIVDPADLSGIVIIDEIDLHLHPKAQMDLVVNLSKAFPKVQFIASTHSPIPLLGAPQDSVILNVTRDPEEGLQITRLDQKFDFKKFNPNLLLSSPVFGFRDLFPKASNVKVEDISTIDHFDDFQMQQWARKKLNTLLGNLDQ